MMANDSTRWLPSSSSRAGTVPKGFLAKWAGSLCRPLTVFTTICSMPMSTPSSARSAMYSMTLVGLGASGTM